MDRIARTAERVEAQNLSDRLPLSGAGDETKNGQLAELTRDYYAIDRQTNDVYYFGEDVDTYRDGKLVGHEGAWLSGVKGAKFGLMMPGSIEVGRKFYQEQAPGVGMDRAEVVGIGETAITPAGVFKGCVHMRETSALEKGMADHKWYAPGVGMVKEGEFALVKVEKGKRGVAALRLTTPCDSSVSRTGVPRAGWPAGDPRP